MRGKVKTYNKSKGFGFFSTTSNGDIYFHKNDVGIANEDSIVDGDTYEFEIKPVQNKAPRAVNVQKVPQEDVQAISPEISNEWYLFFEECLTAHEDLPPESGTGDIQIEQAIGCLAGESSPFAILDYGCGNGRLISGLATLNEKIKKNLTYYGVSHSHPQKAEETARKLSINGKFMDSKAFEKEKTKVNYIFLINVLHEIPYRELPQCLSAIMNSLADGGIIFINDMVELTKGEDNFVSWDGDEISALFDPSVFEISGRPSHKSKKGCSLTTIVAKKRKNSTAASLGLSEKLKDIFLNKKEKILDELDEIANKAVKTKIEIRRAAYLSAVNANIDKQMREKMQDIPRKKRNSTKFTNPYDFEHPASGSNFFGRGRDIRRLKNAILEERSVAVFGLQRIGKTSLVKKVFYDENSLIPNAFVVRLDMFQARELFLSYQEFFTAIIQNLCQQFGTNKNEASKKFSQLIRESGSILELRDTFTSIIATAKSQFKKSRFILFIDEMQDIEKAFKLAKSKKVQNAIDPSLVHFLGSLAKDGVIQLVICSRFHLRILDQELDLQLLKLLSEIFLGVFDEERDARHLIESPVKNNLNYSAKAVEKIILLTGCHPYLIQYLCYELVEFAKEEQLQQIEEQDVESVTNRLLGEPIEGKMRVLYDDFQQAARSIPYVLLVTIAKCSDFHRQKISIRDILKSLKDDGLCLFSESEINQSLEFLKLSKIVVEEKKEKALFYYIFPDLLRQWFRVNNFYEKLEKTF